MCIPHFTSDAFDWYCRFGEVAAINDPGETIKYIDNARKYVKEVIESLGFLESLNERIDPEMTHMVLPWALLEYKHYSSDWKSCTQSSDLLISLFGSYAVVFPEESKEVPELILSIGAGDPHSKCSS